uniref:(northern house mosquito) hypothetical protein n=1 Tax=Culex pipiens TaxID=7175 RepID=A0A8D8JQ34_CULPI
MFDASITSIKSFKTNTHFRIHQLAGAHPGDRREKCKNNIKVSHSHMTRDRRKKKQRRPTTKCVEQLAVLFFPPALTSIKQFFFVRAFCEALNRHHCAPLEIFLKGKVLI